MNYYIGCIINNKKYYYSHSIYTFKSPIGALPSEPNPPKISYEENKSIQDIIYKLLFQFYVDHENNDFEFFICDGDGNIIKTIDKKFKRNNKIMERIALYFIDNRYTADEFVPKLAYIEADIKNVKPYSIVHKRQFDHGIINLMSNNSFWLDSDIFFVMNSSDHSILKLHDVNPMILTYDIP